MMFMGFFMLIFSLTAQEFPKPQMMRKFKADSLVLDTQKSDGSFKLEKKTVKNGVCTNGCIADS